MKYILKTLCEHHTLDQNEAFNVLQNIANNAYNDAQIVAFITVFMMRKMSLEECLGFRNALMALAIKIDLEGRDCLDIVGTGGDGKNTFNISTLSCFVAAGAGINICKHGNYAASSTSGSSNVMEYFGYKNSNEEKKIKYEIDTLNLTFLHAPLFHPALKSVGQIRKNLQIRTFFNLLGPLINPCQPNKSVIGVYNLETMRLYQYALQKLNKKYLLLHSLDGYDEISLTSDAQIISPNETRLFTVADLTTLNINAAHLFGGESIETAAKIFMSVLKNEARSEQIEVVLINTAFALLSCGLGKDINEAKQIATEALVSKKAYQIFKNLMSHQ